MYAKDPFFLKRRGDEPGNLNGALIHTFSDFGLYDLESKCGIIHDQFLTTRRFL